MNFELSMEDYTIILNALHYYKKVDKKGNFIDFDDDRVNKLRDKLAYQLVWGNTDIDNFVDKPNLGFQ
jgi:hypothetical protein